MKLSRFRLEILLCTLLLSLSVFSQETTCPEKGVAYEVSLKDRQAHIVHVTARYVSNLKTTDWKLPVWNALYQVRDFSQYVSNVRASDEVGDPEPVQKVEKSIWVADGDGECATLTYDIFANEPGPFGAQANDEHAFFNWAQVLMYSPESRNLPLALKVVDVPPNWKVLDGGLFADGAFTANAASYDVLVDSPAEFGTFSKIDFNQGGKEYRVAIDGNPEDYKKDDVVDILRKLVTSETEWMDDKPFARYTFIYHIPRHPTGGGMEHANSTAIDISAQRFQENPIAFASVTAHEFFHLWNVKRIRPQSLDPVDYQRENYTRALWFSEGVTSTVSEWMLVRAGLINEKQFLERLARQIGQLDRRPARRFQSVEESSLDAWLEKYPYYNSPGRSVNYYNKGQIVGVLLDLAIRENSQDKKCLRDLFQYMNENYAKRGAFFQDSIGVEMAAEAVAGGDFSPFFEKYVAGTDEIPYDTFFKAVGLRVDRKASTIPDPGFVASRGTGQIGSTVNSIVPGSSAQNAGLQSGDVVEEFDGKKVADILEVLSHAVPGETVKLKVKRGRSHRELSFVLGSRYVEETQLVDVPGITDQMRRRRAAWIRGEAMQ